jgi:metal-responsive CopG/Arc/MetJ family transcriptional regulator
MNKIVVSTRILPEWYSELNQIMIASGQSRSEVMEEAIGAYLGKAPAAKVTNRLDALERRVGNIAAIVAGRN